MLANLANLKTVVDKIDIDKLTPAPNDLAKLSNVVKNDVVKKTEHKTILILQILSIKTNMKKTGQILKIKSIR